MLSKNELLLLLNEHLSSTKIELHEHQDQSKIFSESGEDITTQYFSFIEILLRLHGVRPEI